MAQRHLDLFELRSTLVREPGIGPPQIVWSEVGPSQLVGVLPQNKPDAFPGQRLVHEPPTPVNRPEYPSGVDSGSGAPVIDSQFGPGRHGDRTDPAVFPYQIDNHP